VIIFSLLRLSVEYTNDLTFKTWAKFQISALYCFDSISIWKGKIRTYNLPSLMELEFDWISNKKKTLKYFSFDWKAFLKFNYFYKILEVKLELFDMQHKR